MKSDIKFIWPILSISIAVFFVTLNREIWRDLVLWLIILLFVYLTVLYSVKKTGLRYNKMLATVWVIAFPSIYLPFIFGSGGLDGLIWVFPSLLLIIFGILLMAIKIANRKLLITFIVVGLLALTFDSIGIKTPKLPYAQQQSASQNDNDMRCIENYVEHQGFPFKRNNYNECKNDSSPHVIAMLVNSFFWVTVTVPAYYAVSRHRPNSNNS